MKQKLIIGFSLLLLIVVIGYMARDLFTGSSSPEKNPFDFGMEKIREADTSLICYREIMTFSPSLDEIHGIATDATGRIYVAGAGGIERFDPQGSLQKRFPMDDTLGCIAIGGEGIMAVGLTGEVALLDSLGGIMYRWKPNDDRSSITSVTLIEDEMFIADAGCRIAYRLSPSGKLLNLIGQEDSARGIPGLVIPSGYFDLAPGRDEEIWVVNPGRHLIEAFRMDGTMISSWGTSSMDVDGFCGCCNPTHIAILEDGSFVTSEKGIERIKLISQAGEFICLVAAPRQFDEGTKGIDLAVDPQQRILALDPVRKQVRIFEQTRRSVHD